MSAYLLLTHILPKMTYSLRDRMLERKEKHESIVNTKENIAMALLSNNLASPEWIRDNIFSDNLEKGM